MLLDGSPLSSIGTVYCSSDATAMGTWAAVRWLDWWRMKKVRTYSYAASGKPYASTTGIGAQGEINLNFGQGCPAAVWNGFSALLISGAHVTAELYHPVLGHKRYEVQVASLIAADDTGLKTGDPVDGATVRLVSFGVAA